MKNKFITAVGICMLTCSLLIGCGGKSSGETASGTEAASVENAASGEGAENAENEENAGDTESTASEESASTGNETEAQSEQEDAGSEGNANASGAAVLADGVYTADFQTDNSMFHVSEACDGKGNLTVENGEMTIHISLGSKNIVNLFPGLAEDAQKEGAKLLEPTEDTVTYSDGMTEEVYGFDIPVPALDEEFDVALVGTKGKWYDHKVSVSNPQPLEEASVGFEELADGTYTIELTFEGGSGKASIASPVQIVVSNGTVTASLEWSSPNYDYMIVDGEKYLPVNTEGNSVFEVPVSAFDEPLEVIGDTVAMSTPHEITYTLTFHSDTLSPLT